MYYFGYFALIIGLVASFYLFDYYRRQRIKNLTTLLWSLGFLASAAFIWCSIVLVFKETFPLDSKEIIFEAGQYLFAGLGLVFFYIGAVRLITTKLFYKFILPLVIYVIVGIFITWKVSLVNSVEDIIFIDWIFLVFILLPAGLFLTSVFSVLFQHLYVSKQPKKSYFGALLIAISWFLFCLLSITLIFVQDMKAMDIWFGFLGFIELVLLFGILLLQKGAEESVKLHLKIHGLRKKEV